jgi:hypothetical protein
MSLGLLVLAGAITLSIMTLNIPTLYAYAECHYAVCLMLSVIMMSVFYAEWLLCWMSFRPNVTNKYIKISVIILNVMAPLWPPCVTWRNKKFVSHCPNSHSRDGKLYERFREKIRKCTRAPKRHEFTPQKRNGTVALKTCTIVGT